jgi:hypothetical protein
MLSFKEMKMKQCMAALTASVVFVLSTSLACGAETEAEKKKTPSPAQIAQREKMKFCNAEAKKQELKGDERKKFMSGCLKATPADKAK